MDTPEHGERFLDRCVTTVELIAHAATVPTSIGSNAIVRGRPRRAPGGASGRPPVRA
jgi:hypothetical protein